MAKTSEKNMDVEVIIAGDDLYESRVIPGLTLGGNNRREYFPDNAIAYAYTYTDWNETFYSEGDNGAFYNTNFVRKRFAGNGTSFLWNLPCVYCACEMIWKGMM